MQAVVLSTIHRPDGLPFPRKRSPSPSPTPPPSKRRVEEEEKKPYDAKAEFEKYLLTVQKLTLRLLNTRAGGTYVPPVKLRALQAQFTDKNSSEYQRMYWEALKKSINGLINKVNITNLKLIIPELFSENLIRGRGLYCRSIMKAQAASTPFTSIYAAMTAIINTKLPQVGELLLTRLIVQFRKAFRRNDKAVCLSSTMFIAHLVNHLVAHEIVALQLLSLLLERPTDDSVEVAVGFTREVGHFLSDVSPKANNGVFERFRAILHEGTIDKRVQYMIEVLFQVRKDKYKDNLAVPPELDLVEEEDQITHMISLDDTLDVQEGLGVFKYDEEWEKNEERYKQIRAEILDQGSEESGSESSTDEEDQVTEEAKKMEIIDQTNTNIVELRRKIYLTIMSSVDFEECCHKLMKFNIEPGQEVEFCNMIIECCSQERTYSKFYGLIGERFCKLNSTWAETFEGSFQTYYDTIHRYETNRLRNIARFFGHLLSTDAISWTVLAAIKLTQDETTSSSRIFIKILFQDIGEAITVKTLAERLNDPFLKEATEGMFPLDEGRKTRFSINFFTSIGLGIVTEGMRETLKVPAPVESSLDSENDSSQSSSSYEIRRRRPNSTPPKRNSSSPNHYSRKESSHYRRYSRHSSRRIKQESLSPPRHSPRRPSPRHPSLRHPPSPRRFNKTRRNGSYSPDTRVKRESPSIPDYRAARIKAAEEAERRGQKY